MERQVLGQSPRDQKGTTTAERHFTIPLPAAGQHTGAGSTCLSLSGLDHLRGKNTPPSTLGPGSPPSRVPAEKSLPLGGLPSWHTVYGTLLSCPVTAPGFLLCHFCNNSINDPSTSWTASLAQEVSTGRIPKTKCFSSSRGDAWVCGPTSVPSPAEFHGPLVCQGGDSLGETEAEAPSCGSLILQSLRLTSKCPSQSSAQRTKEAPVVPTLLCKRNNCCCLVPF